MSIENKGLFRKNSLERISSPDKLNEYIKITSPTLMMILVIIFSILVAGGIWFFTNNIPKYTEISGVATVSIENIEQKEINKVYSYIPLYISNQFKIGMDVNVSPEYTTKEKNGYIKGKIINIGKEVVTNSYFYEKFENPSVIEPVLPKTGNFIEVEILLGDWTNEKSKNIKIINGTMCNVSVLISNQKAYEVITQ